MTNICGDGKTMYANQSHEELLAVIHRKCLDCSGGSRKEVHRCGFTTCALWAWREPDAEKKPKVDNRQMTVFDIIGNGGERGREL